ncbi:hypothetical protein GP486_006908, partial [Trichoglossum hirsutum]
MKIADRSRTIKASPPKAGMGLQVLYPSKDAGKAEVLKADIVAVHGLDGDPKNTWTNRQTKAFWLKDFLPHDVPNARVLTFGYNANAAFGNSTADIVDHAKSLLSSLVDKREEDDELSRPIIFIGHSLGGIVIKQALFQAKIEQRYNSISESTVGIMFLGTPHRGSEKVAYGKVLASLATTVLNKPSPRLVKALQVNSKALMRLTTDFKFQLPKYQVHSFYEMKPTKMLSTLVVEKHSALLEVDGEEQIPVDADHEEMCKVIDREDDVYEKIFKRIRRMIKKQGSTHLNDSLPRSPFIIPFPRDSMFVGREDIMANINKSYEQAALQSHIRLALVGLGGVGKSQIAIEYAYRVKDSAPHTSIFWIHASNAARFEQGYREIANKVKIPGRDDPRADMLQLVSEWLSDEKNCQWLIILDNADDDSVFFQLDEGIGQSIQANDIVSGKVPLASFLPETPNGSVLVTSRNSTAAMNLVGYDNIIQVKPMDERDALALLKTRIPFGEPSESEAKALVQALECIPLAITHAAAYIRMREPRITISTYLQLFRESAENQANLLSNKDVRDLRRDHSTRHAVITTWQISFNQIQKTNSAATDLLALISMFDRQGIPEYLLHDNINRLQFEDAIAPLISFALIRAQVGQQSFEMHSLVQLSTRKWLEQNKLLEKWRKESVRIMARAFPSGAYETWTDCQALLPHSKEVMTYVPSDEDGVLNQATIADKTACYLFHRGEYVAAEKISRGAVERREKVLGPEHPDTLISISILGGALEGLGKYGEAEAMHRRALEEREKVLGPEHPFTLVGANQLGRVLELLGKYKNAEALHRRALEGREKVLGSEHPGTLSSINSLGSVLKRLGKYEEAEVMHRQALEGQEKVLGPEHPYTLISVSDLGSVLNKLGKYEEAEALCRRDLEWSEKVLGPEHPETLSSISNLGSVLENSGKYEKTKAMYQQTLEGMKKVLGPEHPNTLISFNNLGSVLKGLGKYGEAEVMYRWALEGYEKVLGLEHPDTLVGANQLGRVLKRLGKYEEAEVLHRRALEGCEK